MQSRESTAGQSMDCLLASALRVRIWNDPETEGVGERTAKDRLRSRSASRYLITYTPCRQISSPSITSDLLARA